MKLCAATDLSKTGERAVELALRWARRMNAELVLVHVVRDPELAPAFSDDVAGDLSRARASLTAMAGTAGVPCRVEVHAAERVVEAILRHAAGAAYLFVGAQGKSALERLRLGSIATELLRKSHVPVVCCPPAA